ncbi:hypothetical protein [Bacillus sp. Gen3]
MKKWLIRFGLLAVITVSIVTPASASEVNPEGCRDALCWIQY